MLDHLYSPQMSDIFVRLLNFNRSVFAKKEGSPKSNSDESGKMSTPEAKATLSTSETVANEIRQCTIFAVIQRIGTGYSFDQQKSALGCLLDLPEDAQILSVMTRPSSLEQIKSMLQIEDEDVKLNCFKLLHNMLCRSFDTPEPTDWQSASSSAFGRESSKVDEQEL